MKHLLIFEYLEQNARLYPDEVALVEVSPKFDEKSRITWKDYSLVQPVPGKEFRREMTWKTFDERANMFANLLFTRGIRKGEKVAVLLMNSIEWLPMYFGILKTGAVAVPLNYRYDAQEIKYCLEKADCSMLVFGPEFVSSSNSARKRNRTSRSPSTTTRRSTTRRARRVSRKRSCIRTEASSTRPSVNRNTTVRPMTTSSSASRPCTTPARRCTGSAPSWSAAKRSS